MSSPGVSHRGTMSYASAYAIQSALDDLLHDCEHCEARDARVAAWAAGDVERSKSAEALAYTLHEEAFREPRPKSQLFALLSATPMGGRVQWADLTVAAGADERTQDERRAKVRARLLSMCKHQGPPVVAEANVVAGASAALDPKSPPSVCSRSAVEEIAPSVASAAAAAPQVEADVARDATDWRAAASAASATSQVETDVGASAHATSARHSAASRALKRTICDIPAPGALVDCIEVRDPIFPWRVARVESAPDAAGRVRVHYLGWPRASDDDVHPLGFGAPREAPVRYGSRMRPFGERTRGRWTGNRPLPTPTPAANGAPAVVAAPDVSVAASVLCGLAASAQAPAPAPTAVVSAST